MGPDEYRQLVERASAEAARSPRLHRVRIVGLVFLGYAYLLGTLVVMLALIALASVHVWNGGKGGGPAGAYPIAILIMITIAGVRAFLARVRVRTPEGTTLREHDAPALFAELDALRRRLRSPSIHEVIIDASFNAGVIHVPRRLLGLFGVSRRYLVLGLPFLDSQDTARCRAVLAHELAHLAGGHGRFSVWTYGIRATWVSFLSSRDIQQLPTAQRIYTRFFDWFASHFLANTFALARAQEYAADRMSAAEVGMETVASALVRSAVMARFYDHFVDGALDTAKFQLAPPVAAFDEFAAVALAGPEEDLAKRFLKEAFARSSDLDDVHPSLADRLRALAVDDHAAVAWKAEGTASAAQELLGSAGLAHVRHELGARWTKTIGPAWRVRRQQLLDAQAVQHGLEEQIANGEVLTFDQRRALVSSTLAVDGLAKCRPVLEAFVRDFPDSPGGRLLLAEVLLLSEKDDAGLAQLHAAMAIDRGTIDGGCALAHAYLVSTGRHEQAETYRVYAETEAHATAYFYAERQAVRTGDELTPHGLSVESVAWLARELGRIPDLRGAFLVRKTVLCAPEYPCLVLALDLVPRLVNDPHHREREYLQYVGAMPLPLGTMVFILRRLPPTPRAEIPRVEGARVL